MGGGEGEQRGRKGGGRQDSDAFLKVCGPSRITHKHIRCLLKEKLRVHLLMHNKQPQSADVELIRRSITHSEKSGKRQVHMTPQASSN